MDPETVRDTLGTIASKTGIKREMKIYRMVVMFLLVLIIIVFIGMFAAVFLAAETSKEVQASHGRLTDTSGRSLSTSQKHDPIHGLRETERRRLLLSPTVNNTYGIEIPASVFYQTRDQYGKGATKFVISDRDSNFYTIDIKGGAANSAWVDRASLSGFPDSMCIGQRNLLNPPDIVERNLQNLRNDEDELDRSLCDKDDSSC